MAASLQGVVAVTPLPVSVDTGLPNRSPYRRSALRRNVWHKFCFTPGHFRIHSPRVRAHDTEIPLSTQPDDLYDELDDTEPEPERESGPRSLRNKLRQAERERDELRAQAEEAETLRKENALFKANLSNLNEDQQAAVLATSKEMSAEALRSQAERLGFVEPAAPAAPVEDLQAFDRVAQATAGGTVPNPSSYEDEVAGANSPEELRAVMARHGRTPEIVE